METTKFEKEMQGVIDCAGRSVRVVIQNHDELVQTMPPCHTKATIYDEGTEWGHKLIPGPVNALGCLKEFDLIEADLASLKNRLGQ